MKNLIAALLVILTASNLSAEEYLECEPALAVKWQAYDDLGGEKGFTELDVTKMSDAQLTLVNGLLVFLEKDNPRPFVMVPDFIEPDALGRTFIVNYRQRERKYVYDVTMIFDDPHCYLTAKSALSVIRSDAYRYVNQSYVCECLSKPYQAKLFD